MNRQKLLIFAVFLVLTGGTVGQILKAGAKQKLGAPGVLTRTQPGTRNLLVVLPEKVPGYAFRATVQAPIVGVSLPDDTSFGSCIYKTTDGFESQVNVVLMGTDRSSIHKPEVCLPAQGWQLNDSATTKEKIQMRQPYPYELPAKRLTGTLQTTVDGKAQTISCVYVYWFVDDRQLSDENWQWKWWMARDLLLTGVLDRFSYISYFSTCIPGQEEATYERMKTMIMDTVPKFQLVPRPAGGRTATGS